MVACARRRAAHLRVVVAGVQKAIMVAGEEAGDNLYKEI